MRQARRAQVAAWVAGALAITSLVQATAHSDDVPAAALAAVPVRTVMFGEAKLSADLYDAGGAPGQAPRPAVLMIHGGGWGAGSRHEFDALARWLALQGALPVLVDYRLTTQGARWPAPARDVEQAVQALREHAAALGIDPHRIVALGGSAGGHLAAWLGTTDHPDAAGTSSRVDAVISLWGPWDLTVDTGRADARHMVDALMGGADPREASPLFRIDAHAAPALLIHGDADALVPPDQSLRACVALRAAHVRCERLLLPGEDHAIADPAHVAQAARAIRDFIASIRPQ